MLSAIKRLMTKPQPADVGNLQVQTCPLTPDIWKLEQFNRHLIFVPDDLQSGGQHNQLLKDGSFVPTPINPICYSSSEFTMWLKDLGDKSYPVVLPKDYKPSGFLRYPVEAAKIRGELWGISPQTIISLDKLRQNGVWFSRQRVNVMYPFRQVRFGPNKPLPVLSQDCFKTVTAWMYVGITSYWDPQIGGIFASQMDLHEHDNQKPWIKKFYKFVPK